jgi:hypothetical protein
VLVCGCVVCVCWCVDVLCVCGVCWWVVSVCVCVCVGGWMCCIPRWTAGLRLGLFGKGEVYFFVSLCDTHEAETWEATVHLFNRGDEKS